MKYGIKISGCRTSAAGEKNNKKAPRGESVKALERFSKSGGKRGASGTFPGGSGAPSRLEIWNELSCFWIEVRNGSFLKKAYKEKKNREKEIFRKIRMAE